MVEFEKLEIEMMRLSKGELTFISGGSAINGQGSGAYVALIDEKFKKILENV